MSTQSQTSKILSALRAANGQRVSLPDLAAASGAYAVATRVSNLRKEGYAIFNETKNGHSEYWLVEKKEEVAA